MTPEDIKLIYSFTSFATKISGNYQNAQDIIHDIFLRILKHAEKFESLDSSEKKNYIAVAVINHQKDRERKYISRGKVKYHVPLEKSNAAIKPAVYAKLELEEIMKNAKENKHFPILMMNMAGYKCYEIAREKNMSINTVLGRCRYARKFLKRIA